jgi:hypothetical protein
MAPKMHSFLFRPSIKLNNPIKKGQKYSGGGGSFITMVKETNEKKGENRWLKYIRK